MDALLRFFELLAMVLWLGSVVSFSVNNAPVLHRVLAPDDAARAVRALFRRYYLLGTVCGGALCLVSALRGILWTWSGMILPSFVLFLLLTLLTVYARHSLSPRLNTAILLFLLAYLAWMAVRGW